MTSADRSTFASQMRRDFEGYGERVPEADWPGRARIAVSVVLNYEEGGEPTPLDGDPAPVAALHEAIGAPVTGNQRNLSTESMYEFGSRAGFWRLHRILVSHAIPVTVYAVGQALERNPSAGKAMAAAGWEVAGHGWRWIDYKETPRDEERRHIQQTISTIERICGQSPLGWYTGRRSENTRRLIVEQGTFLYDSDSYADDLPYWEEVEGAKHLVVPYALDTNDYKFLISNGFVTSRDFLEYLTDAFDVAYAEGGRMMTLAVHCRIAGRPGRAKAVTTFLDYVKEHEHVWFATRADIARHWYSRHPPD